MKKIIVSMLLLLSLFLIAGCGNENKISDLSPLSNISRSLVELHIHWKKEVFWTEPLKVDISKKDL